MTRDIVFLVIIYIYIYKRNMMTFDESCNQQSLEKGP